MPGQAIDRMEERGGFGTAFNDDNYDHEARDIAHDLNNAHQEAAKIMKRAYGPYGAYPDKYTQQMHSRDQVPISDIVQGELRHEMDLLSRDPDNPVFMELFPTDTRSTSETTMTPHSIHCRPSECSRPPIRDCLQKDITRWDLQQWPSDLSSLQQSGTLLQAISTLK